MNDKHLPLHPREKPVTHCEGVRVDPRGGLTGAENLASSGFDPWNLWPIAYLYTD